MNLITDVRVALPFFMSYVRVRYQRKTTRYVDELL